MTTEQRVAPTDHANRIRFDVLHALRIKGYATSQALAAMIGSNEDAVELVLHDLATADLAGFREGRISGWRLTVAGTTIHARALDEQPADPTLNELHLVFTPLNARVKELCTAWQLRDGVTNDHTDAGYDRSVVAAAGQLHRDVDRMLAETAFARAGWYRPRLRAANERFAGGDGQALARPLSDSYHDVWMELHQDLILTLGLTRTDADA